MTCVSGRTGSVTRVGGWSGLTGLQRRRRDLYGVGCHKPTRDVHPKSTAVSVFQTEAVIEEGAQGEREGQRGGAHQQSTQMATTATAETTATTVTSTVSRETAISCAVLSHPERTVRRKPHGRVSRGPVTPRLCPPTRRSSPRSGDASKPHVSRCDPEHGDVTLSAASSAVGGFGCPAHPRA